MTKQTQEQTAPNEIANCGSISYSDNINSEDYISQFLDSKTYVEANQDHDSSPPKKDSLEHNMLISQSDEESKSGEEASIEEEKLRSSFHNFQKHLVTTLRKCVSFGEMELEDSSKGIEKLLWDFFMECPKMTRTLIYLVFGGLTLECSKVRKFNKKYGLEKLIKSYSQSDVKKAQKSIRTQTLYQLKKTNIEREINQRRMKDKDGFRVYFEAFIEELKSGGFNKRLPKEKKELVKIKLGKEEALKNSESGEQMEINNKQEVSL